MICPFAGPAPKDMNKIESIPDEAADLRDAAALERRINRRLVKIQRDSDEIMRLQMRVQRYRQEIQRLAAKRTEKLTLRLSL